MSKQWYVLRAVSGQEKKVKTYIESEIERLKLEDQVAQVLIPTEKVFEMRNGKKKIRERSFLPGYVLMEADLAGEIVAFWAPKKATNQCPCVRLKSTRSLARSMR
jgi:transcription termination/antitermination protein NusG